jgi:hypothetical protein
LALAGAAEGAAGAPGSAPALAERLSGQGLVLTAEARIGRLVDAVNVTDGSLARVRMGGLFAAAAIRQRLGVEVIAHLTPRDRNRIALQADVLGAAAFGLRAVLVVSGDPPDRGDEPEARAVGDLDAEGLIRAVGALNRGTTASGRELEGATRLAIGCGANPGWRCPRRWCGGWRPAVPRRGSPCWSRRPRAWRRRCAASTSSRWAARGPCAR